MPLHVAPRQCYYPSIMLHVGLTGGIATGKSHVTRALAEHGAYIIDADELAHKQLEPGRDAYREIVERFGGQILNEDGTINRSRLAGIVFHDETARLDLNKIVHPRVLAEEEELRRNFCEIDPAAIVVVDAALLIETGNHRRFDKLVVVACDPQVQLLRLMERNRLSLEEALARIRAQMPITEKVKYADYVIDTSGTLRETRKQVENLYRELVIEQLKRREGRSN